MPARAPETGAGRGGVFRRLGLVLMLAGLSAVVTLGALNPGSRDRAQIEPQTLAPPRFATTIRRPEPPAGASAGLDERGRQVSIACMVCHSTRTPNARNATMADLDEFHQGMHVAHGGLTCLSCHNADDYGALRLAGGARIEFADVQTLCAQCHAKIVRSYDHGAHGGMTGYWDLNRGGRVRNGCLDCHDPHAPAFPQMIPTFKPIDRFLEPAHG